ncbi:hypothetical protein KY285_024858 [Solanum tuberosum]|nr:hypothetical protein KY284_024858 [Solanum tuberosum]KAH0677057.1 hypothetical protein KY285_024858 [Solanum tuberosum]
MSHKRVVRLGDDKQVQVEVKGTIAIKTMQEAFENFRKFKALVEKQTCSNIKALRTDRGCNKG